MCRMIAFSSVDPLDASPYLAGLGEFCRNGNLLDRWEKRPGGNHPDGWGIAYRSGEEIRLLRSGLPAARDPTLNETRIRTDRFIGHVRYASNTATVNAGNSHPFQLNGIALAHNGTFRGKIGDEANDRNVSDTLVFLERLTSIWTQRTLNGLSAVLLRILSDRSLVGEYSAANLAIASKDRLFAFRRYRKDPDYYSLYLLATPELTVAASEPLDGNPDWRLLGNGELVELAPGNPRSCFLPLSG
jgi:predicted glutamine amidotransferase